MRGLFCRSKSRFSLSPRGDGNNRFTPLRLVSNLIFFIPARGRKQERLAFVNSPNNDFLYPREGTETALYATTYNQNVRDFLYPREGTETRLANAVSPLMPRFSLSPRGDGNTFLPPAAFIVCDFIYPREGTETCIAVFAPMQATIFFIPARGRKRTS